MERARAQRPAREFGKRKDRSRRTRRRSATNGGSFSLAGNGSCAEQEQVVRSGPEANQVVTCVPGNAREKPVRGAVAIMVFISASQPVNDVLLSLARVAQASPPALSSDAGETPALLGAPK